MKVSPQVLEYLSLIGIGNPEEQRRFLFPRLSDHYDPFRLDGMEEGVEKIIRALKGHKKVLVWGDADLDGIASTCLVKLGLEDLGFKHVQTRIPVRDSDGFGLVSDELRNYHNDGIEMLVTVDVGITNVEEANLARQLGMELLITDHHEVLGPLPEAVVINPKKPGSTYPCRELSGSGVALKLVTALFKRMVGMDEAELARLRPHYWVFAALGTVSDRCPLLDENRLIVKQGLENLRAGGWRSFEIWLEETGLSRKNLTVFDLYSRGISPFYAAHPEESVRLLFSQDDEWMRPLYAELNEKAARWQRGKQQMISEAQQAARDIGGMIVAVSGEIASDYLGTTAHALRERFGKSAIVLAPRNKTWHAECRGLEQGDLLSHLSQFEDMFLTFGGHRKACGFTLKPGMKDEFFSAIERNPVAQAQASDKEQLVYEYGLDSNLEEWALLAPFGEANPSPRLLARGVEVKTQGEKYLASGIPVFLPYSLRNSFKPNALFDVTYTIKADGGIRVLGLTPV